MPVGPVRCPAKRSSSSSPLVQGDNRNVSPALDRFEEMASLLRPGRSACKSTVFRCRLRLRTSTSRTHHGSPLVTRDALSNLSAPELLLTGRALDGLAGSVTLFVEFEVAVRAHEVGSYPAEAVFEIVTICTHAITRLLRSMKRRSLRRSWPRRVFANGSG